MKKVLFINGYIYLPGESAMKRTFYLFDMMKKEGHDVTFLTSDFNHYSKQSRDIERFRKNYPEYADCVHFIHMKPYEKNISVKRYVNGMAFERAAVEWFAENGSAYDVVYLSLPASVLARGIRKYCDRYGTKLIIDVNDLWPESLRLFLKKEWLYKAATYFMRKNAQKGYANADGIVAVSDEYLQKAACYNSRATQHLAVYIGAMLDRFDDGVTMYADAITKESGEFWLAYIGTLGASYDIETVIRAVDILRRDLGLPVRFKIMGHGPAESALKTLVEQLGTDGVDFMGFMEYSQMAAWLSLCDVCVNCIKQKASQSVINKVADYFAAGKPLLNCGSCGEMRRLVEEHNAGIHYQSEDVESLVQAVRTLYDDSELADEMGRNARELAQVKFDREWTHREIIRLIERI